MDGLTKLLLAIIGLVNRIIGFFFLLIITIIIGFYVAVLKCNEESTVKRQSASLTDQIKTMIIKSPRNDGGEKLDPGESRSPRNLSNSKQNSSGRTYHTDRFGRNYYIKKHTLARGQDFVDVCHLYNANATEVKVLNGLRNGDDVKEGDTIVVPIYVNN